MKKYEYKTADWSDGFAELDPSADKLYELQKLKRAVQHHVNTHTCYSLAHCYLSNGAVAAGRFWARMWCICLALENEAHFNMPNRESDQYASDLTNMMGNSLLDAGEMYDEILAMYG